MNRQFAIVTGASTGIGYEFARAFARAKDTIC
jgi:short-subunit dehydrogenase